MKEIVGQTPKFDLKRYSIKVNILNFGQTLYYIRFWEQTNILNIFKNILNKCNVWLFVALLYVLSLYKS